MVAYPGWHDPIPKIKSAFLMGGPRLAVQEVASLTGLPIQHYVVADFQGFADAIDAVGGITVDIPARIYDPLHSGANFEPGVQHLDGAQALAWIRVRQNEAGNGYRVNDFQRMNAAVSLMRALEEQVVAHLSPGELTRLVGVWDKDVATDLSKSELVGLALELNHARIVHITLGSIRDSMDLMGAALPGVNAEGSFLGAYYDILTPAEIARDLAPIHPPRAPHTGLPPLPPPSSLHVLVTDDGAGATLAAELARQGVHAVLSPLVPKVTTTTVVYPPGQLLAGMALGRAVGQGSEVVEEGAVPGLEVETN
jgi:LCP family protein required for cell wall assembly